MKQWSHTRVGPIVIDIPDSSIQGLAKKTNHLFLQLGFESLESVIRLVILSSHPYTWKEMRLCHHHALFGGINKDLETNNKLTN